MGGLITGMILILLGVLFCSPRDDRILACIVGGGLMGIGALLGGLSLAALGGLL